MLYTRKGDGGTTKTFDAQPGQRISKSSCNTESLGALDEVNSFLGLCKVQSHATRYTLHAKPFADIVGEVQQNLFIVQAELAGAPKTMAEEKIKELEVLIDSVEKELPPIKTFFVSGGTELAVLFDIARTLVRKAERRVVGLHESGERKIGEQTLAYLNRLSSLMYALARLSNHLAGIKEESPHYK